MGISGNLKTMALPELLQWLSMGQKTGTLVIDHGEVEKKVYFKGGSIISSASNDPKEYLGSFLAAHGYLPEDQINEALERQKAEGRLLGQILVDMDAIAEDDLHQMLRLKTEESVYDIFTWSQGDFEFFDDELPEAAMVPMSMDVQGLVLEGTRRLDEWQRIREVLPSNLCVPVAVADLESLDLEELDLRILEWVDDDRTVEEISTGSLTGMFHVAGIISAQVRAGTVKAVRPRTIEVKVEVPVAAPQAADQAAAQPAQAATPAPPPQPAPLPSNPVELSSGRTLRFAGSTQGSPDAATTGVFASQQMPASGFGGAPAAPQPSSSEAESLVQEATSLLRGGDLEKALSTFRRAKDAQGSDATVLSAVAQGERDVQAAIERDGVRLTAVPKLKCSMDQLTQLSISPQEGFMLTRVDGSYDLKSILKMSPMPPVDAQMLFWRLKKLGHVAV